MNFLMEMFQFLSHPLTVWAMNVNFITAVSILEALQAVADLKMLGLFARVSVIVFLVYSQLVYNSS